jgi:hypothetical protein
MPIYLAYEICYGNWLWQSVFDHTDSVRFTPVICLVSLSGFNLTSTVRTIEALIFQSNDGDGPETLIEFRKVRQERKD